MLYSRSWLYLFSLQVRTAMINKFVRTMSKIEFLHLNPGSSFFCLFGVLKQAFMSSRLTYNSLCNTQKSSELLILHPPPPKWFDVSCIPLCLPLFTFRSQAYCGEFLLVCPYFNFSYNNQKPSVGSPLLSHDTFYQVQVGTLCYID